MIKLFTFTVCGREEHTTVFFDESETINTALEFFKSRWAEFVNPLPDKEKFWAICKEILEECINGTSIMAYIHGNHPKLSDAGMGFTSEYWGYVSVHNFELSYKQ